MAFATLSVATELVSLLSGLSGIGGAQLGVPASIGPRVYATVTAAGQNIIPKTTGTLRRGARYTCSLVYRLDTAEASTEAALMDMLDLFLLALYADRTLNSTCKDISVDVTLADLPEYAVRVSKEYREFPVVVTAYQDDAFTINP